MQLAAMLGDVVRSLFRRPVTRPYPKRRRAAPDLFRGTLRWTPGQCTGCGLCVKDCPANALELIVIDKASKQFAIRYAIDHCTFCGQCIQSCRFNSFDVVPDSWELADTDKRHFQILYGSIPAESGVAARPGNGADGKG